MQAPTSVRQASCQFEVLGLRLLRIQEKAMRKTRTTLTGVLLLATSAFIVLGMTGFMSHLRQSKQSSLPETATVASKIIVSSDEVGDEVSPEQATASMATRSAVKLAAESGVSSTAQVQYATLPLPVPITEANAISFALGIAPAGVETYDPIARRVSNATLVSTLGWNAGLVSPDEPVWIVAVRTRNMLSDAIGKRAGFNPSGLMTPVPSLGYVLAFSEMGVDLGGGNLAPEDSDAGQRYSVIESLESIAGQ